MKLVVVLATLLLGVFLKSPLNEAVQTQTDYQEESHIVYLKNHNEVLFLETFNDKDALKKSWVVSTAKTIPDDGPDIQYDGDWITAAPVNNALPNDLGLTYALKDKHRAISAKLSRDFIFSNYPLVIQYEVTHQEGQSCGNSFIKLISKDRPIEDLKEFNNKTPYTIMFGLDNCGIINKLHFSFNYKNPLNNNLEEKHCKTAHTRINEVFTDSRPHLFKLVLTPDSNFSIYVDNEILNEGSLLQNCKPPVNPPKFIHDPHNKKPSDWEERESIPDPNAKIPDNWNSLFLSESSEASGVKQAGYHQDEAININGLSAKKPGDWNEELDGEMKVAGGNSSCKPWSPPFIKNSEYNYPLKNKKEIWRPRKIPNPDFFEDKNPFLRLPPIDAVGLEVWSTSSQILFDNIIITQNDGIANIFAASSFFQKEVNVDKSTEAYFAAFVNSWLWAIYIVVFLTLITLIVLCCCRYIQGDDFGITICNDLPPDGPSGSVIEVPYHQSHYHSFYRQGNRLYCRRMDTYPPTPAYITIGTTSRNQNIEGNSEEIAFRQRLEERLLRHASGQRTHHQYPEEMAFVGRAAPRVIPERVSHSRELPAVIEERREEMAALVSDDDDDADENLHQPSAEPVIILKRRR